MTDLTPLERELLESMNGQRTHHADGTEMRWGAWMGVCLEGLIGHGYATHGPSHQITEKGRERLRLGESAEERKVK